MTCCGSSPSRVAGPAPSPRRVRSPAAGLARVTVTHHRSAQMVGFLRSRAVAVLAPTAGYGQSGTFVSLIQQLLLARHVYVIPSGVFDQHTALALDAYHRLLGRGFSHGAGSGRRHRAAQRRGQLQGAAPARRHARRGQPRASAAGPDLRREGLPDLPDQLGQALDPDDPRSLPGLSAHARLPARRDVLLGLLLGGYAIHGYDPAPDFPASHGCMRVPIVDAISIYDWLRIGDVVDVYYP